MKSLATGLPLTGLYLILDPSMGSSRPVVEILTEAADAGVRLFQYRDKSASMRDAYRQATTLRKAASEAHALFIVNDRCDLALAVEADGVHLGQRDLPLVHARALLGPTKIIGISTHTIEQVRRAVMEQPDYIGFGPIFSTETKPDHDPVVGLDGLRAVRPLTRLPMFGIGGITADNVGQVMQAGADGAAVISAVLKAPHVGQAVRKFLAGLSSSRNPVL